MKVRAIAVNTFREAIRNKILYSVVFFAALLVGVASLFGAVTIGSQVKMIKDFGLFSLSFFGAIITIISGTTLLNREIKQKTVYNILSKPVRRWQFVLGKHLGLTLTVGLLVTLMGLGLMAYAAIMEGRFDHHLLYGIYFAILEVMIVASVSLFFSSLVVTVTLSGLFTLATYIAGRSIRYLKYFTEEGQEGYNPVLAEVIRIFDYLLPDLSLFNFSDAIVYQQAITAEHFLIALAYAVAYSAAALVLAAVIFERRELV